MRLSLLSLAAFAVVATACTSENAQGDNNGDVDIVEDVVTAGRLDCAALGDVGRDEAPQLTLESLRNRQTEVASALNAVLNDPSSAAAIKAGNTLVFLPTDTATAASSKLLAPADLVVPWFTSGAELVSAQEAAALSGRVLAGSPGTVTEIGGAPVLCDGYAFSNRVSVAVLADVPTTLPPVEPLTPTEERSFIGQSGQKCEQFEELFADIRELDLQGALQALDVAALEPSDVPVGPITVVAVSGAMTDLTSSVSAGEQLSGALSADEQIVFTDGSTAPVTRDVVGLTWTINDNVVGCGDILFRTGVIHLV